MFFGAAARRFASSLFATHPPLEDRIRAIEPRWNGSFPTVSATQNRAAEPARAGTAGFAGAATTPADADELVERVGTPDGDSLQAAQALISTSPEQLRDAAHDPFEARALIYSMLIDPHEPVRSQQLDYLGQNAERGVLPHLDRLREAVAAADSEHQLTLLEMAMPALKELSDAQYRRFMRNAAQLITADGHVEVFEWVLHRVLVKDLKGHFDAPGRSHGNVRRISQRADEAGKLLSILASQGSSDVTAQLDAYAAGMAELNLDVPFSKQEVFDYQRMNHALGRLRELKPLAKPALIKACARTIMAHGNAAPQQQALMRGIAATLDCPLPPQLGT